MYYINIVYQKHFLEKIKLFLFENALNLTHELLYDSFSKKYTNFFVKFVIQKLMC